MKHIIAIAAALLLSPIFGLGAAEPAKPNIVVVLADDLGWGDTSPYGNTEVKTRNFEPLAAQGVKFNQCYSECGVCSPSRSAILTGRTPYRNGVWQHLSGDHGYDYRMTASTPNLVFSARFTASRPVLKKNVTNGSLDGIGTEGWRAGRTKIVEPR